MITKIHFPGENVESSVLLRILLVGDRWRMDYEIKGYDITVVYDYKE
ncbi:hypothetical protein RSC2_04303 [Bacillus paralicheniformis]|nr:hypothetical protein BaLi_c16150 [Bacillus paralicheniformis ATCC 9945a]BCE06278.1 hypothetical protein RSC1_02435 [Bacillus paralicheniformis]BCE12507.1 hypothetical protein RSC2_04303 [Bacillus paralicheniformis]BCE14141.1 hypothetical protein RSC3_01497 [Bacillus paralicheniformis]GIN44211.1 hypothetical protein J23TS8_17780 [Bacillus paralicheniformis]